MNSMMHDMVDQRMRECLERCEACHDVCMATISHCLSLGGPHAEMNHIRLLQDCAEICQTGANYMLRNSPLHTMVCGVCAQVCERCAEDCERMGDEMMMKCAQTCRECAQSCREMSGMRM